MISSRNEDTGTERRHSLVKCAEWLAQNSGFYAQQCSPFIFGAALLWLGFAAPELAEQSRDEGVLGTIKIWAISAPVVVSVISFILSFWGARYSASVIQKLRTTADEVKSDLNSSRIETAQVRAKLADAEEAELYLKTTYNDLLTRGARSFLKKHVSAIDDFGDHARVSLYAHKDGEFVLAGRYTEHPEYREPNRQRIPDNQGCVGEAWRNGGECYMELPDPHTQQTNYYETLKESCNIGRRTAGRLRMRSSFYYAKAVNSDTMRAGVIVYESTRSNVLIRHQLGMMASDDEEHLARIIEQARLVNPFMTIRGRDA